MRCGKRIFNEHFRNIVLRCIILPAFLLPVWAHRLPFGFLPEISTCDATPNPAREIRVHNLDCNLIVLGFICFVSRDEAASPEDAERNADFDRNTQLE